MKEIYSVVLGGGFGDSQTNRIVREYNDNMVFNDIFFDPGQTPGLYKCLQNSSMETQEVYGHKKVYIRIESITNAELDKFALAFPDITWYGGHPDGVPDILYPGHIPTSQLCLNWLVENGWVVEEKATQINLHDMAREYTYKNFLFGTYNSHFTGINC
jgi:hypothetical protein